MAAEPNNRKFAVIALTIAIAAFIVLTMSGIGDNLVYYWGPAELRAAGDDAIGASIRLGGLVQQGSVDWDETSSELSFTVVDKDGETTVPVHTTGIPPQLFREGIGVVVEGTMTEPGIFEGTRLLVSHDNQYRAPEEGEPVETRELIESARGADDSGVSKR